ncbi:hypothetical protein MKW92_042632 [Papaver armeniacum]|nr:hypothetical protein MKW92_042632 [Papaver armeniacum]
MAKKNSIVLCLFLVLFIFVAGGETKKHINKMHKTCKEKWETVCVIPEDCDPKCFHHHRKQAKTECFYKNSEQYQTKPDCLVQEGPTGGDLCVCNYAC